MTYLCGPALPDFDWPDAGDGACCWGAAAGGGARCCTCWEPVYDLTQVPVTAGTEGGLRTQMCGDCAYRPGSPERAGDERVAGDTELLDRIVITGDRFWCHQGIRRIVHYVHGPTGTVYVPLEGLDAAYDPPIRRPDGLPFKADGSGADLCAGWAARRLKHVAREASRG
jgi:hypothetical protein